MYLRSEVVRTEDELHQQVWRFTLLDRRVVIDSYSYQTRPTKRHKFRVEKHWQRCDRRDNTLDYPPLPYDVIEQSLRGIRSQIQFESPR